MSEKGLTNISLKKINKSKVYQYIYRKKRPPSCRSFKGLPVYLQKKNDFQAADRSGTADGFIHCQSESESSGAGRSY